MKEHSLKTLRRAGVPLAAFETADPAATIAGCIKALGAKAEEIPLVVWDVQNGQRGLNKGGCRIAATIGNEAIQDPAFFTREIEKHSKVDSEGNSQISNAIFFMHNAHRFLGSEVVMQGVWNLRDSLKSIGATVILLCPTATLPIELQQDVVIITEPLPTADEVKDIVESLAKDANLSEKQMGDKEKIVDTMLGISAFGAEQAFAMSVTKDGVDLDMLWERKRKMVEQTPGLSVSRGGESFDGIGGCDNVKKFLTKILKSKRNPVRCIGFIDEIEKMFAGASGDLSGVSQDQLAVFLKEMQDSNIPGMIFIGPPGCAKSAVAKAAGGIAGAEVLSIDTGAMTGSLVGESQSKIRKAMATFKAVSQSKGMFIATCNKISNLPPELRRRFTLGTFFFDLPNKNERKAIWEIWLKKYDMDPSTSLVPDDEGWTGAEIRACVDIAYRSESNLHEAAKFIVPVSKSAGDMVEQLRAMASGRFISASDSGVYEHKGAVAATGRKFQVEQVTTVAEIKTPQPED